MNRQTLSKILITGASGFIGRNLIEYLKEEYCICALARRTQQEAGVQFHKNIEWILVDIAQKPNLANVIENIRRERRIDFIIHLAAYYSFDNTPHPEYERTNVQATRYLLEYSKELDIKRFIFASSIAACKFPPPGQTINERSPPDANFPYAVSKNKCEEMLKEYSESFPCTILRLAAVYSDWCEYGPLYMFLKTWLSSSFRSRIIGGHGESAIPYVHINSVIRAISLVLEASDRLPQFDIYVVSPEDTASHLELYDLATRLYFEKPKPPVFISKWLATILVYAHYLLGCLVGIKPFVRPWMMKYIDIKLAVEATYTYKMLGWEFRPRLNIKRRMLFLIENLKSSPVQWHQRNEAALAKTDLERPNLIISELMQNLQGYITNQIFQHLLSPNQYNRFKQHQDYNDPDNVRWFIEVVYNLLISSVRNGDRYALVNYARSLAKIRSRQGFDAAELCQALYAIGELISASLLARPETEGMETRIHDLITLTIQLAVDEIEDTYERISRFKHIRMDHEINEIVAHR